MRRYVVILGLSVSSCTAFNAPRVVTDPDPTVKIPAMRQAAREKDSRSIEQLVKDLDSDDPAVRFYAINALEQLTGERKGYVYYETDEKRQEAVDRWKQWFQEVGSRR